MNTRIRKEGRAPCTEHGSRGRKYTSMHSDSRQESLKVCAETESVQDMPSHVKTYNGSEDPEDHLKIFQAAAKTERWAMPTWCHMFNIPPTPETARKKCIRDPIVLHNIKQRDGESKKTSYKGKVKSENVNGAPE
ncbi:hypothetical protein Tco_1386037 [Tanacetum coccineum]